MRKNLTPRQQREFKQQADRVAREVNVWADQQGIKCNCHAREHGDNFNHSSVCPVFKQYYAQWQPPYAKESRAQRIVARLLEDDPPLRVAVPSQSKIMNRHGHGLGTSYHGTPEDWAEWQRLSAKGMPVMGPEAAPKEALKNKYGGMPPHPPYTGG
jgi:hypothetical protein